MRCPGLLAWRFITAAIVIAALGGAGYWLYRDAQVPGPLAAADCASMSRSSGAAAFVVMVRTPW